MSFKKGNQIARKEVIIDGVRTKLSSLICGCNVPRCRDEFRGLYKEDSTLRDCLNCWKCCAVEHVEIDKDRHVQDKKKSKRLRPITRRTSDYR